MKFKIIANSLKLNIVAKAKEMGVSITQCYLDEIVEHRMKMMSFADKGIQIPNLLEYLEQQVSRIKRVESSVKLFHKVRLLYKALSPDGTFYPMPSNPTNLAETERHFKVIKKGFKRVNRDAKSKLRVIFDRLELLDQTLNPNRTDKNLIGRRIQLAHGQLDFGTIITLQKNGLISVRYDESSETVNGLAPNADIQNI